MLCQRHRVCLVSIKKLLLAEPSRLQLETSALEKVNFIVNDIGIITLVTISDHGLVGFQKPFFVYKQDNHYKLQIGW